MTEKNEQNRLVCRIAGRNIEFDANYPQLRQMCRGYETTGKPEYVIRITEADIEAERQKSLEEEKIEGLPHTAFSPGHLETTAAYRKLADTLVKDDIILFHGSAVAVDGQCYLFTARSGTGKSTHTRLWREMLGDRAVMINDDKPLLQVRNSGVTVWGTPWNGKHRLGTNTSAPLRALCILQRGEFNEICPIAPAEAMPMLLQQCHRPADPEKAVHTLDLLGKLTEKVSFYRLRCNMEPEAARVSYEAMRP